jgi:hypothetical protein
MRLPVSTLGLVAVGDQQPVAVAVGARQLGEHERVEAPSSISLAHSARMPRSSCR